jgi:hypothetical protein
MMPDNFSLRSWMLVPLLVLAGCTPNTKMTGSWKNPGLGRTYHKVFVSALSGNAVVRSTVEEEMAKALKAKGHVAIKSIDVFPPGFIKDSVDRGQVMRAIRQQKADGILTISLQRKETESRYVSGTYAPMSRYDYYGSFGGYYGYWYPAAYSPGYYQQEEVYYLETNLYDAASELLVWSGQSRTYAYDGIKNLATEFAAIVVEKMRKDTILN